MAHTPICPYCGDGMESVGTLNHIECVVAVMAERDALRHGYEILATKLSEANAALVRLETQPRSDYAELEAERDKWEWVARDACRELAYETHVNPQSPLDYRIANWRGSTP